MKILLDKVKILLSYFLFIGNIIILLHNVILGEVKKLSEVQIAIISITIFIIYFTVTGNIKNG